MSGLSVKNEKSKGKFAAIDINSIYQEVATGKPKRSAPQTKQGLQSLGKVGTGSRRMPAPATLPSLKSEHDKGTAGDGKDSQPQVSSERKLDQVSNASAIQVSRPGGREDFPQLGVKVDGDKAAGDAVPAQAQYGPGPSLRPQNVASWREGGGRHLSPRDKDDAPAMANVERSAPAQGQGQPLAVPPFVSSTSTVRPVAPPFQMFGRPPFVPYPTTLPSFSAGAAGMQYGPGVPGVPYQHPIGPFGPGAAAHWRMVNAAQAQMAASSKVVKRPPIIKQEVLKTDIDSGDGGWASACGEVDYNEKLVFSDEEEEVKDSPKEHVKSHTAGSHEHGRPVADRHQHDRSSGHPTQTVRGDDGDDMRSALKRNLQLVSRMMKERQHYAPEAREDLHDRSKHADQVPTDRRDVPKHVEHVPSDRARQVDHPSDRPRHVDHIPRHIELVSTDRPRHAEHVCDSVSPKGVEHARESVMSDRPKYVEHAPQAVERSRHVELPRELLSTDRPRYDQPSSDRPRHEQVPTDRLRHEQLPGDSSRHEQPLGERPRHDDMSDRPRRAETVQEAASKGYTKPPRFSRMVSDSYDKQEADRPVSQQSGKADRHTGSQQSARQAVSKQTDRQTGSQQTDRQTGSQQTDRQTGSQQTDRQTGSQQSLKVDRLLASKQSTKFDKQVGSQSDRPTGSQSDRPTGSQHTDRPTGSQHTDRPTGSQLTLKTDNSKLQSAAAGHNLSRVSKDNVPVADRNKRAVSGEVSRQDTSGINSQAYKVADAGVVRASIGQLEQQTSKIQSQPAVTTLGEGAETSVDLVRHQTEQGNGSGRGHVALGRGRSALSQSESKVESGRGIQVSSIMHVQPDSQSGVDASVTGLGVLSARKTPLEQDAGSAGSSMVKTADSVEQTSKSFLADSGVVAAGTPAVTSVSQADVKSQPATNKKPVRDGRQAEGDDGEAGGKRGSKRRSRGKRSSKAKQLEGEEENDLVKTDKQLTGGKERQHNSAGQDRKDAAEADKSQSIHSSARNQSRSDEGQGAQSSKRSQGRPVLNKSKDLSGAERSQSQPSVNKSQGRATAEKDPATPSSDKGQVWPGIEKGQGRVGMDRNQGYGRRDDEGMRGNRAPAGGSSQYAPGAGPQYGGKEKTSNAQDVWMHGVEFVRGGRGVGRMRRPLDDWLDDYEWDDWHGSYADMGWAPEPAYAQYAGVRTSKRASAVSEAAANARKGRVKGRGRTLSTADTQPGTTLPHDALADRNTRSQQAKAPRKRKGKARTKDSVVREQTGSGGGAVSDVQPVTSVPVATAAPGTETDKEPAAEEWETASESSEHGARVEHRPTVIPPLLPDWPRKPADSVLALADLKLTDAASSEGTAVESKDKMSADNKIHKTDSGNAGHTARNLPNVKSNREKNSNYHDDVDYQWSDRDGRKWKPKRKEWRVANLPPRLAAARRRREAGAGMASTGDGDRWKAERTPDGGQVESADMTGTVSPDTGVPPDGHPMVSLTASVLAACDSGLTEVLPPTLFSTTTSSLLLPVSNQQQSEHRSLSLDLSLMSSRDQGDAGTVSSVTLPTSPASELDIKIASVKSVWDTVTVAHRQSPSSSSVVSGHSGYDDYADKMAAYGQATSYSDSERTAGRTSNICRVKPQRQRDYDWAPYEASGVHYYGPVAATSTALGQSALLLSQTSASLTVASYHAGDLVYSVPSYQSVGGMASSSGQWAVGVAPYSPTPTLPYYPSSVSVPPPSTLQSGAAAGRHVVVTPAPLLSYPVLTSGSSHMAPYASDSSTSTPYLNQATGGGGGRRMSSPQVSEEGGHQRTESVRALQQKQRQEVLHATQSFLNPAKKPLVKHNSAGSMVKGYKM